MFINGAMHSYLEFGMLFFKVINFGVQFAKRIDLLLVGPRDFDFRISFIFGVEL
jgi:hypothetical protein